MHSKKSKPLNSRFQWKAASGFSEEELAQIAAQMAMLLRSGDRVLLEGPMGVGKSTFARGLLIGLGVHQPPEGSPTFAIAHEYQSESTEIVHIDFYRIRSEVEIEEAGIPSYFWERELIVISEWLESWPDFQNQVRESGRVWEVELKFESQDKRSIEIFAPNTKKSVS